MLKESSVTCERNVRSANRLNCPFIEGESQQKKLRDLSRRKSDACTSKMALIYRMYE